MSLEKNLFVEIDLDEEVSSDDKSLKIKVNDLYKKYLEIKTISKNNFFEDSGEVFYNLALKLKDLDDNYYENTVFLNNYPRFSSLTYEQFRYYISNRKFFLEKEEPNVSYLLLYCYEIINNINCNSYLDGLLKLTKLLKLNKNLYPYISRWIKDYFIYYPLQINFKDFINENNLNDFFPNEINTKSNVFLNLANNSNYNILSSIYYIEFKTLFENCFMFCFDHLKEELKRKKKSLDNFLYTSKESYYFPFENALFSKRIKQTDKVIVLSDYEMYYCKDNNFYKELIYYSIDSKSFIGYMFKKVDQILRNKFNYKYKISVSNNIMPIKYNQRLNKIGIDLESFLENMINLYFHKDKEIIINKKNLEIIRKESLETQEKLIVEEEVENNILEDEVNINEEGMDAFVRSLSEVEKRFLEILINNENYTSFLRSENILKEIMIDEVNSKSIDYIKDYIIENDSIYIDYLEELKECLYGTKKN